MQHISQGIIKSTIETGTSKTKQIKQEINKAQIEKELIIPKQGQKERNKTPVEIEVSNIRPESLIKKKSKSDLTQFNDSLFEDNEKNTINQKQVIKKPISKPKEKISLNKLGKIDIYKEFIDKTLQTDPEPAAKPYIEKIKNYEKVINNQTKELESLRKKLTLKSQNQY